MASVAKLDPTGEEEGIGDDHKGIGFVADEGRERSIDSCDVIRPNDLDLQTHGGYCCRHFPRYDLGVRIGGIDQQTYARSSGSKFV